MSGLQESSGRSRQFRCFCSQELDTDTASTCGDTGGFPVRPLLTVKEYERNTPEWVVKVCLYFFVGSPLALHVDAGLTAVTSGCGKGKYGEDLQSRHNADA